MHGNKFLQIEIEYLSRLISEEGVRLSSYEVVGVKSAGRYLLKRVSPLLRYRFTIAEHLRKWNTEWFPELCETMLNDKEEEEALP